MPSLLMPSAVGTSLVAAVRLERKAPVKDLVCAEDRVQALAIINCHRAIACCRAIAHSFVVGQGCLDCKSPALARSVRKQSSTIPWLARRLLRMGAI
jgi:hypothetical protein